MMFTSSILLAAPLMMILTVLQTSVLPYFPFLGVIPSLPFMMALAWGLLRGANEGIVWAFMAGFFMDLFTAAPTGGLILTYMIAVLAACMLKDLLPSNRTVVPMLLAGLASIIQQLLYALYLGLFGYGVGQMLASSLLPTVLLQTFLILPIYWLLYLVQSIVWPKPVEV
jgi:rod shape-determining protein MreD